MENINKVFKVLCGSIVFAGMMFVQQVTYASSFDTFTSTNNLNYVNRNINLNGDGERVSFIVQDGGILKLYSRDGKHDYLSFTSYYGDEYLNYSIKKLQHRDPKKIFFEINMIAGVHGKNSGYWIVGKYGDKWIAYVSLDSLASIGYTPNAWHSISSDVNDDGELILTSRNSKEIDFQAKIYWDKKAQWFGIARIK